MKLASTIEKMPIVSVDEGEQIAVVEELLVGRKSMKVEFLLIKRAGVKIFPQLLAFKDILGIGGDYIVIKAVDVVKQAKEYINIVSSGEEYLSLTGLRSLSMTGDIIGSISDYQIEEKTGAIKSVQLDNMQEIAGDRIASLSNIALSTTQLFPM